MITTQEALKMATAYDFINIIRPTHDRTSCDDKNRNNSFYSRNGKSWHGRCTRCMWLDIADGKAIPDGFDSDDCYG